MILSSVVIGSVIIRSVVIGSMVIGSVAIGSVAIGSMVIGSVADLSQSVGRSTHPFKKNPHWRYPLLGNPPFDWLSWAPSEVASASLLAYGDASDRPERRGRIGSPQLISLA